MENNILKAALEYEGLGYSVIPLNPSEDEEIGKKPYVSWTEFQNRKPTQDEIKKWWNQFPKAMIGVVTGKISGLMAVDADDTDSIQKAEELIPEGLYVPVCTTPRDGKHYHFIHSNGFRNSNDGILHVRGEAGYIIMPPSTRLDGRRYSWVCEPDLKHLPELPSTLKEYLSNIAFSLYRGVTGEALQSVTSVTKRYNMFLKGHRDEDLFHIAHQLVKAKTNQEEVEQVIEILAKNCVPPFPDSEIKIKIQSALKRAKRKERNFTEEVKTWVSVTKGIFSVTNCALELQSVTKTDRSNLRVALHRLVSDGIIERIEGRDGFFRKIEVESNEIDWESCDHTIVDVKWPFNIESLYQCLPKNITVVAGSPDAGKTAFCLNFAMLNMDRYPIKYFSSEMGALELKTRLKKFPIPVKKWKQVKFIERNSNFADIIDPDGINVVDYIEAPEEAWKIATPINEIFRKLQKGICIIALQKPRGRDVARGGESTLDRPRLYLSMGSGEIKIVKCKNWASDKNPSGLSRTYKIVQGCEFKIESDWSIPWEEVRR